MRRSSRAPVSLSEPKTSVHSSKGRLVVTRTGYDALTAHVLTDPEYQGGFEPLQRRLRQIVYQEFGIRHITIQIEQSVTDCTENHHIGHLEATSRS